MEKAFSMVDVRGSQNSLGKLKLLHNFLEEKHKRPLLANEGVDPLRYAFDKKSAVHAGLGGSSLSGEQIGDKWNELLSMPRTGKSSIYIHIPFCESRCLYCGFYGHPVKPDSSRLYTDALLKEIGLTRGTPAFAKGPIHAVYLGGGTPTALEGDDLTRILTTVRAELPLANDCEITVEGRIHNFGPEKIEACLAGGANRFSIGVQSFDTRLRQGLGRIAPKEQVLETLSFLKDLDEGAVIIDLIYGLPGQTMEMWEGDLKTLIDLKIDGADLYQLNVFKGSPLYKAIQAGKMERAADLPEQSVYFSRGLEIMEGARYRRLSISHWGASTRERNLYNLLMKQKANCLAFGAGAGGSLSDHFYFIENNLAAYMKAVSGGVKPVVMCMTPPEHYDIVKKLSGELELGRINLKDLGDGRKADLPGMYEPLLSQWEKNGLLVKEGDWATLTRAGQFWQVNLTQALIDYLAICTEKTKPLQATDF